VVMDHENNPNSLLTSFFLDLRDISKSTLDEIADLDSLKDIDIKIEGLDLSEKVHYTLGKTEQQNTQVKNELGKHIPKDIPEYIPDNKVDFHDCIGNQEQIMDLLDYVTRVMRYNHEKKENEFKDIGIGFQNNIVIYGPPGTGKTMAVNAIAEWAKKIAEQFGKPLHITDMIKDTLTCYKDMSSKILEEFFKKEEEGDGIYINIFDEAGGGKLYNSNKNGDGSQEDRKFLETAKKVMRREYSGNVINIIITNYTDESSLEAAFGQAFEKIKIEGPQTAEDFGTILKNQFREYASKIGLVDKDIDYSRLGSIFTKYKKLEEKLSDKGFYVTGRTVRQVCKSFKPEKRIHETPEIIDNNKYSGEKFYNSCKKIHGRITEEKLETAIIQTLENEIESKGYRIDKNKKIAAD
ncbi:AAA family ATPase, partial [Candidatus Woesearchaeota archaeon]|nr:AAA family ATPase [Candidatus Woesearchaeota archaeon]